MKTASEKIALLKAAIAVEAGAPWFDGHFPGRPILPGVAELVLALEALRRESGAALPLRGIGFARLRHLVLPGDRLELSARESATRGDEAGRLRFELSRAGTLVANGEFIIGEPRPPEASAAARIHDVVAPAGAPDPAALLPHQPPMRLLDAVLAQRGDALECLACIPRQCALVEAGTAPALAAIEAAAQAAAAWEALQRRARGEASVPRVGYLVAMRDVEFFSARIAADQAFRVAVALESAAPPLTHYRFEAVLDGAPLARGSIATFLAD